MQAFAHAHAAAGPRAYANRRRMMRVTMRATYLVFFAAALAGRVNPFARKACGKSAAKTSLLAETRARAAAIVPFIFMG